MFSVPPPAARNDGDHVLFERREELRREVGADDVRVLVERDLPGDVEDPPWAADDPVRVAAGLGEGRRVDELLLHGCSLPVGMFYN